jgi:nucleotide-binding universal stress UspA family protein
VCVSARTQPAVNATPRENAWTLAMRLLFLSSRESPAVHIRSAMLGTSFAQNSCVPQEPLFSRANPKWEGPTAMFKKILLPVDLSDRHQKALDTAADLAKQSTGEVTLLHVIEIIAGLSLEEEKSFYKRLEKSAQQHLARLAEYLKRQQIACRMEILYGHRGPEIIRYAGEESADLIVLTSPRIDPNNPGVGWGSLSYKIGMLATCPVLLVK